MEAEFDVDMGPSEFSRILDGFDNTGGSGGDMETETDEDFEDINERVFLEYTGAGPRDLDGGDPPFGGFSPAIPSGEMAGNECKGRKVFNCKHKKLNGKSQVHRKYSFPIRTPSGISSTCKPKSKSHVTGIARKWKQVSRDGYTRKLSESNLFCFPDCSDYFPITSLQWKNNYEYPRKDIEVVLVTQFSSDRLPNLRLQLARWRGKSSVAVYIGSSEILETIVDSTVKRIQEAESLAKEFDQDA